MSKINKIRVDNTTYDVEDSEVKSWARANEKPSYNYSEINNTPDLSNFITKDVNNLTNYELKINTGATIELTINSSTYEMTLNLKNSAGTTISTGNVDLPLETMVVGATYDNNNKKIILELKNGTTLDVPVGDLINGLQSEITSSNRLDASLVDDSLSTNKFTNSTEKTTWNSKYDKPSTGIPKTDLAQAVQDSLDLADSAIQDVSGKEDKTNKVTTIDSTSTDTEYASAKAVWDLLSSVGGGDINNVGILPNTRIVMSDYNGVYFADNYSSSFSYALLSSASAITISNFCPLIYVSKNVQDILSQTRSENVNVAIVFGYQTWLNSGEPYNEGKLKSYAIILKPDNSLTRSSTAGMEGQIINTSNHTQQIQSPIKFTRNIDFFNIPNLISYTAPTTDTQLVAKKYVDDSIASAATTYTGYDATKTQVLKNVNGVLTWVDEV